MKRRVNERWLTCEVLGGPAVDRVSYIWVESGQKSETEEGDGRQLVVQLVNHVRRFRRARIFDCVNHGLHSTFIDLSNSKNRNFR